MKRLKPMISSDSESDDLDTPKIKDKYKPQTKLSKNKIDESGSKRLKNSEKQMSIETAFSNINHTKRKIENPSQKIAKKLPKLEGIKIPENVIPSSKSIHKTLITPVKEKPISSPNNKGVTPSKGKGVAPAPNIPITKATIKADHDAEMQSPISTKAKAAYSQFMHREGPQALGSKEIPEGSTNCLLGMTFVITGVLDSIERDDAQGLIERYGGKVTKAISGRTTYLVVGQQPGDSKIEKANKMKTKQINEDELFDLIRKSKAQSSKSLPSKEKAKPSNTPTVAPKKNTLEGMEKIKKRPSGKPIASESLSGSPLVMKQEPHRKVNTSSALLVDKYRPTSVQQIIGQQGARSPANKLLAWLRNFERNLDSKSEDEGSEFRAALLSGPPGIGKTTTANLVCKELGYNVVELNASSVRSKNSIRNTIAESLTTTSFYKNKGLKHCVIMDEVDGMAGNEDRGGINELIQIIKTTRHPIICICNDHQSRKLQSFVKYVYDLRFRQLTADHIKVSMLKIAGEENISIPEEAIQFIIRSSNFDMRQILNNLHMWSVGNTETDTLESDAKGATKEFKLGPFDVLKKVFSHENVKTMNEKSDLFFYDYQLAGLFVQENYPHIRPYLAKDNMAKTMKLMSLAADSIAFGDIVSTKIRSTNAWGLLPTQAMFSSVIPGEYLHGRLTARIDFPGWLGKFSKTNKNYRILSSLSSHLVLSSKGGVCQPRTLSTDYSDLLLKKLVSPLRDGDIDTVLARLNELQLRKEDMDLLIEASSWSHLPAALAGVTTQTKSALTRTYNKSNFRLPYAIVDVKKSIKSAGLGLDLQEGSEDEGDEGEGEDEDNIESDGMIVKRGGSKPASKTTKSASKKTEAKKEKKIKK